MAELISKYKTADGKVFNSEAEADAHEAYLEIQGAVEAFIEQSGLKMAQAGLLRKYGPAMLDFMGSDAAAEAQEAFEAALVAAAETPKPKRTRKAKAEEVVAAE